MLGKTATECEMTSRTTLLMHGINPVWLLVFFFMTTNLLLQVVSCSETVGLCYVNDGSVRKTCDISNEEIICCNGEMTNIQVHIYRSDCNSSEKCSLRCCSNGQEIRDQEARSLFEDMFNSTNCNVSDKEWSEHSRTLPPEINGFYYVIATFECRDEDFNPELYEEISEEIDIDENDDEVSEETFINENDASVVSEEFGMIHHFDQSAPEEINIDENDDEVSGNRLDMTLAVTIPVSITVITVVVALTVAKLHRNSVQQRMKTINYPNNHVPELVNLDPASNSIGTHSSKFCNDPDLRHKQSEYDEIPADRNSGSITAVDVNACNVTNQKTLPMPKDRNYGYTANAASVEIPAKNCFTGASQEPDIHIVDVYTDLEYGNQTNYGSSSATGNDDPAYSQLECVTATIETESDSPQLSETKADDQDSNVHPYFVLKKPTKQDDCYIGVIDTHDETDSVENHYFVLKKQGN